MKLKDLIDNIDHKYAEYEISNLATHQDEVTNGSLFFAIKGNNFDGIEYVSEAISKGAIFIITDRILSSDIPHLVVSDVREWLGLVSTKYYKHKVKLVAIVGSSGKTTTSYIISNIISESGAKVGIIGTLGAYVGNDCLYYGLTTPDTIDLHKIISQMENMGVTIIVMEVSAQAIYLKKISGMRFDIAVFTNISKEHIDFFGDIQTYIDTKLNFLLSNHIVECVINVDDIYGRKLAHMLNQPTLTYGLCFPANTFSINIALGIDGMNFVVNAFDDILYVSTNLIGEYNVYNIMASINVAKVLGIDDNTILRAIKNIKIIGRNEKLEYMNSRIVIDFAHTTKSVDMLLEYYKRLIKGRLITLMGCTDYSDKDKRINMGKVLSKYSDVIFLTADNPNYENVYSITKDMKQGIDDSRVVYEYDNRIDAIEEAIKELKNDDILILLGKGGERFQKIKGVKVSYDELAVVKYKIEQLKRGNN